MIIPLLFIMALITPLPALAEKGEKLDRMEEIACTLDLRERQDARHAIIRLIGDVFPSPEDDGTILSSIEKPELLQRTRIAACLEEEMRGVITFYKQSGAFHLDSDNHVAFHDIQWMNKAIRNQMYEQMMLMGDMELFTPEMVPVIQTINRELPFERVIDALGINPDIRPVVEAIYPFIHAEIYPDTAEAVLKEMGRDVATLGNPELVEFGAHILMRVLGRALFYWTEHGQAQRVDAINELIDIAEEGLPGDMMQNMHNEGGHQAALALYQEGGVLPSPEELTYAVGTVFMQFNIPDTEDILTRAYLAAQAETQESFRFKNLSLREGDMFMNADAHGLGQFFQSLIQIPAMYSHKSIIVTEEMDGWRVYYRAEIQNDLQITEIPDYLDNGAIMRFNHTLEPGFTERALAAMLDKNPKFDASFNPDMAGHTTQMSLYCPEMIHHLFVSGFGQWDTPHPSPYPQGGEPLPSRAPVFLDNARLMTVEPDHAFFVPDRLIANPDVELVNLHFVSPADELDHPQRDYMQQRLSLLYFKTLRETAKKHPIKPLSLGEKAKLWGMVRVVETATDVDLNLIDFANSEIKLIFFKIFMLNQAADRISDITEWPLSAQPLTPAERDIMRVRFKEDVLSQIGKFFNGAS